MKYEILGDCGELGIEFDKIEGDGAKVSRDFLTRLLKRIVERSTKYYEKTKEHVFFYRERQLHSVVGPSIADITPSYLVECPLTRKPRAREGYSGSTDYWIGYRKYSFLMELKHAYFAYRNAGKPRKSIDKKFQDAMQQLSDIKKDECRALTRSTHKGMIKIALQAVVYYKGAKHERALKDDFKKRDFKDLFKRLMNNTKLGHKSNLRSLWLLDRRLVKTFPYESTYEIYPAVAFVGNISEVIK